MGGPLRFLVSKSSATSCLPASAPSTRSVSIRRNHSDLVKFSSHDAEYDKVFHILKQMQGMSTIHIGQDRGPQFPLITRKLRENHSLFNQQSRLTGETQAYGQLKRPADDVPPFPEAGKRPRLASHVPENSPSQAGEPTASRDPVSDNEMGKIKEELISRLYFSKIDERLTHLAPAQANTCRWFLTHPKYQSWQDVAQQPEHGGFLWMKGHPGTGKSTLMKFLFQDTNEKSRNDPSRITLSFFFLARGTTEEKTTSGLYRSLLHQLFEVAPDLRDSLQWMTMDGSRTVQRDGWSEEALKETLKYALPKLGHRSLTMFVDALDECDADKADDMVSFFEELCDCATEARVLLRICFSSRHYPTVAINKGIEFNLEDEQGHTEDIRKYVKSRLRLKSKSKHAEQLRAEIIEKASGIFLWVVLVLDILNNENSISIQKLRAHLQAIPPRLNDLFQMILARDGDNLEQLQLCLNWILFARCALKPQELYFAIQLGQDNTCSGFWDQADLDSDDMKTFVRNSSKGLAEVTRNKASEVQFIHESVRDFLLGKYGSQWSGTSENLQGHGHRVLRDCCLAQLDASIRQEIDIPDPLPKGLPATRMRDEIGSKFPFLEYSVRSVLHHSNLAQINGIEQGRFLSDFPLRRWVHLNNILERYDVRRYTDSVSLLYILAENNLGELIRIHPSRKLCFDVESERCGAPILAAFARNSRQAVQAFLRAWAEKEPPTSQLRGLCEQYKQHGNDPSKFGRDFTFKGRGSSPILDDLIRMDEETAALAFILGPYKLGDRLSLISDNDPSLTPLSLAIDRGHEALVKLLLQKAAHVDKKNGWLDSPLLQAVRRGNEAIVRILFDTDANSQPSRQGLQSALCGAVTNGDMGVVRFLLDKGADVDSKDNGGERALSLAVKHEKTAVVKFLLSNGADIESRDNDGRTPLMWAVLSFEANNELFELLFERGAKVNSRDKHGLSPLSYAAATKNTAWVVELLLDSGADIEAADKDGRTPLSWAAYWGRLRAVVVLLEEGAAVDTKDKDSQTPLSRAVSNRHFPGFYSEQVISRLEKAGSGIPG